ncbi:transposase [Aggregatimonas sangjinii]|uniref:Transposase n=1 Tax=Aggregatimonas sangjinii TaxID=2583587 RepID=A0A5B7SZV6_9FLAO|nr:transposase [Aggregatimonas sangjinii]
MERLWRSVNYEKYLNPPEDGLELFLLLAEYFYYYNNEKRHESIDYDRPIDVFKKAAYINLDL